MRKGALAALVCAAIGTLATAAPAGAAVLHDQNSGASPFGGVFSQHDGSTNSQVADDFTVPAGETWAVQRVDVSGSYPFGSGPISSANVRIFPDAGGLPSTTSVTFQQLTITPSNGTAGPNFSIPLTSVPPLGPGTYWISVQVELSGYPGNVWDWTNRSPQVGNPAAMRTSTLPGCMGPAWAPRDSGPCGADAPDPDQMFSLSGTSTTTSTPPGNPASPINPAGNVRKRKCKKGKHHKSAAAAKKRKCGKKKH